MNSIKDKIIKRDKMVLSCYYVEKNIKSYITNGKNKTNSLVILKLCDYKTREHVFVQSLWGQYETRVYEKYRDEKKPIKFERAEIKLDKPCIYKFQWDDVNNGLCTKEHLGEVRRNIKGQVMIFDTMQVFVCVEGLDKSPDYEAFFMHLLNEEVCKQYDKHYLPIDDKNYKKAILYRNDYMERMERLNAESNHDTYEYEDYNYEEQCIDRSDMSEEDATMEALEKGMGELYGY